MEIKVINKPHYEAPDGEMFTTVEEAAKHYKIIRLSEVLDNLLPSYINVPSGEIAEILIDNKDEIISILNEGWKLYDN